MHIQETDSLHLYIHNGSLSLVDTFPYTSEDEVFNESAHNNSVPSQQHDEINQDLRHHRSGTTLSTGPSPRLVHAAIADTTPPGARPKALHNPSCNPAQAQSQTNQQQQQQLGLCMRKLPPSLSIKFMLHGRIVALSRATATTSHPAPRSRSSLIAEIQTFDKGTLRTTPPLPVTPPQQITSPAPDTPITHCHSDLRRFRPQAVFVPKRARVLYTFQGTAANELSVALDEEVTMEDVDRNGTGWSLMRNEEGKTGWVPTSYLEELGLEMGQDDW